MRAGRRMCLWAIGLVALSTGAALLIAASIDLNGLLRRAVRVVRTDGWNLNRGTTDPTLISFGIGATYQWIDAHRILFFRNSTPGSIHELPPQTLPGGVSSGVMATLTTGGIPTVYDTRTRQERPLSALARLFDRSNATPADVQVSPDGKWILWTNENGNYQVATLQGTHYFQWNQTEDANWLPDDRLIEVDMFQQGRPFRATVRRMVALRKRNAAIYRDPIGGGYSGATFVGADGCLLITDWGGRPDPVAAVSIYSIQPGKAGKVRVFPVSLLKDSRVNAMVYSQAGDRIAWVLTRSSVPPLTRLLARWLPHFKPRTPAIAGLWVSRIDGRGMREVGHVPNPHPNSIAPLDYVRWLPDGKRLSFVYQNTLYTVPAD